MSFSLLTEKECFSIIVPVVLWTYGRITSIEFFTLNNTYLYILFSKGHLPAMIPVDAELCSVATAKPLYGSFVGSVVNNLYSLAS